LKKDYIGVSDCEEGDILAEAVRSKYGAIVAVKNTTINKYIKSKFYDMGIERIWVYQIENSKDTSVGGFQKRYRKNVLEIKEIISGLGRGENLDIKKLKSISESLYREINKNKSIVNCLNMVKSADEYTYTHSINVAFYCMLIGKWMKLSENEIKEVIQAGLLHDVGKAQVSVDILNKKTRLLPEEFEEMKKHTIYGYNIVKGLKELSEDIRKSVLMHHEREDNSGYPIGVHGNQLNLYSKIVAVSDVYDAMTSDRVYKKRTSPFAAFEMFSTVGIGRFDTRVVRAFQTNLAVNYIGEKVLMNSGDIGEIVYVPPYRASEPIVRINSDYIDLSRNSCLKIKCML